jgi:hypothetical protein
LPINVESGDQCQEIAVELIPSLEVVLIASLLDTTK